MEKKDSKEIIKQSMSAPAKTLFTDITEHGLDEAIKQSIENSDILQKIPIIKWLFIGREVHTIIQSTFFLKKYASFIGPINAQMESSFWENNKFDDLFSNENDFSKLIDQTIIELDRYQTEVKAKLLGELFVQTFENKAFSISEYNTLIFSIESMHPYSGINSLKEFYHYRIEFDLAKNEDEKRTIWSKGAKIDYSPIASTGLLILPTGGAYTGDIGGASISDIGFKFYENVVSKVLM